MTLANTMRLGREVARKLFVGMDVTFMAGRFMPLLPFLIISQTSTDVAIVEAASKQYQSAIFFSSMILYAAPQIYLVKRGIESLIFPYTMAISLAAMCCAFYALSFVYSDIFNVESLIFFTIFRSYYIYISTRFREQATYLLVMLLTALCCLGALALTHSLLWATLPLLPVYYFILKKNRVFRKVYAFVGVRSYFLVLYRNIFYFVNTLFQQVYTQIFLFAYAFISSGSQYLLAVHTLYIYNMAQLFHQIVFRATVSAVTKPKGISAQGLIHARAVRRKSEIQSLLLGVAASVFLYFFVGNVEKILFGKSLLSRWDTLLLGGMLILQSMNYSWSAILTGFRQPRVLLLINFVGLIVIVGCFAIAGLIHVELNFFYVLLVSLLVQCLLRIVFGNKVLVAAVKVG